MTNDELNSLETAHYELEERIGEGKEQYYGNTYCLNKSASDRPSVVVGTGIERAQLDKRKDKETRVSAASISF